ncbi:hypothetical protein A4A49_63524 [Nicotiana attenuata]|uniref:Ubiquitin-like protease family profile domain-containing protein n=1 Tax=Nicotiana attenuata TaxID=49451 RepID=A0A314KL26_NICAT|nr:hypothetical protein A4A49_63524 [Nicotiana attenuata]
MHSTNLIFSGKDHHSKLDRKYCLIDSISYIFLGTDCGAFLIKYVELLMMGKDVEKFQPEDITNFRKELATNLWAHGEWKRNSGYDTPRENVGDDYDSENETSCPKEL